MKRILTIGFVLILILNCDFAKAQSDTTHHVAGFTLQEQNITLRIGESRQLHVNPADANVRWMESWGFVYDPVLIVDDKGFVTALREGNSHVMVELKADANKSQVCYVTVNGDGSVRKGKKSLMPVGETADTGIKFSLSSDGLFTAEGTYYGSGAQINDLNYIVSDQCIFLWFEINYEDSTKMFYPQPFKLEIDECNAQQYNIYLNNRTQTVESQRQFASFTIARGTSNSGPTGTDRIVVKKEDDNIYNLKGQKISDTPGEGVYIQSGAKYLK